MTTKLTPEEIAEIRESVENRRLGPFRATGAIADHCARDIPRLLAHVAAVEGELAEARQRSEELEWAALAEVWTVLTTVACDDGEKPGGQT